MRCVDLDSCPWKRRIVCFPVIRQLRLCWVYCLQNFQHFSGSTFAGGFFDPEELRATANRVPQAAKAKSSRSYLCLLPSEPTHPRNLCTRRLRARLFVELSFRARLNLSGEGNCL